jgi:hybrid cluster-associated redox disulfide protein
MITSDMKIEVIIRKYPKTITVLKGFGLDCSACSIAEYEDLAHGAGVHKVDIEELLKRLNEEIS